MKSRIKILIPCLAVLLFASCSKDYLNDKPYTSVLLSDAVKTEGDLLVAVTGMYTVLRTTDLFGRTLPVKGDIMADNTFVITANSGRYISMNSFTSTAVGDAYAQAVWQNAYIGIKYANSIIAAAPGITATANTKQYLGEAYATRALLYFELARNYGHPYTAAPNDLGVPLILTFDQNLLPKRNTVKEVYTQVIADLEQAYSLMSVYRGTSYFSKYAARALEARVYQNMGDWANAKTTALDVVTSSGFALLPSTSYVAYWGNPVAQVSTKNETLYEVESDYTSNNGFDQIGFIYLTLGGGYGDILANSDLYAAYSATDVRKSLMSTGARSGQAGTAYFCQKYINAANGSDKDDTKIVRLADVMLILAEAYYNTADPVNANLYLNKVATQRDPSFTGWTDAGAQILEDILVERRKELAFEGSRLWDLVRLQRSWTKTSNQSPLVTIAVTPANTQLILPIPTTEINANPNIVQNPGY